MSIIKIKRGLEANLPTTGINVGELFFTTDTHRFLVGKSATTLEEFANLADVLTKADNLNSLSNKGTSRTNLDVYSKAEVDSLVTGMDWSEVVVASTATLTLSGTQTVDGVALSAGDRILVKNQTDATENGIYVVATGSWTRSTDADSGLELASAAVVVAGGGTVNGNTAWLCASNGITIGTTDVSFIQFPTATYTAGEGLKLQSNQFSMDVSTLSEKDAPGAAFSQSDKIVYYDGDYDETVYITVEDFVNMIRDGKVKFDSGDSSPGYLADKIVEGLGISVEEGTGDDENKVKISFDWSSFAGAAVDVDAANDEVIFKDATDGDIKQKSVNGLIAYATIDGGTF